MEIYICGQEVRLVQGANERFKRNPDYKGFKTTTDVSSQILRDDIWCNKPWRIVQRPGGIYESC